MTGPRASLFKFIPGQSKNSIAFQTQPGNLRLNMVPEEQPKSNLPPSVRPARSSHRRRRSGRRPPRRQVPQTVQEQPTQTYGDVPGDVSVEPEIFAPPAHAPTVPALPPAAFSSPLGKSIEQVSQVIEELKHVLDEMEEVLETLELAERQKIDDEREIESLQRALRQLHRPRDGGQHRH
jgi:hypothetical protein